MTSADHEKFVSYMVPSKYEESMKTRGVLGLPAHSPEMPPRKMIGRDELTGALQNNRAARAKSQGISLTSLGDDKPRMLDLFIMFHLVDTFDGTWLNHMGGALKGFEIAGAFQCVGVSGGRSGSAISFQCQANAELESFETTIAYCKHTVIPAIRKAEYLSSNVASVSMQYSHPGTGDSGISSKILFERNTITNTTGDIITFHASEQSEALLTLQPKEARALFGSLSYITGSPPADAATQPNGEAPKETEAAKPTTKVPNDEKLKDDKPKNEKPKEWVTYQPFGPHDILTGMPAELIKLSNGYQVNINGPQDEMLQIKYDSEWPSGI